MNKFKVLKEEIIYEFLKEKMSLSKNSIKNLLTNKYVYVNNKCITKYDYNLKINDIVEIKSTNQLDIIYEDKDMIVVNKPYGLLTVSTEKEKDKTLYKMVSNYVKRNNKNNKIFIINRIDKDTSGIVMFSKNEKIKELYQNNWNKIVKERKYIAIVNGILKEKEGEIKSNLIEDKNHIVHSSKNGKEAITKYKVLKEKNNISLLDINILTGRKNQIRVHMKEKNTPILGDSKYGQKVKDRMYLHAYKLSLVNPKTKKIMEFKTQIPEDFNKIIN